MPDSTVSHKIYSGLMWVYMAGYCGYLLVAGWSSWSTMTFWDWCVHISWESVYALAWPILIFR